jgi:hypothetical protein
VNDAGVVRGSLTMGRLLPARTGFCRSRHVQIPPDGRRRRHRRRSSGRATRVVRDGGQQQLQRDVAGGVCSGPAMEGETLGEWERSKALFAQALESPPEHREDAAAARPVAPRRLAQRMRVASDPVPEAQLMRRPRASSASAYIARSTTSCTGSAPTLSTTML